MALNINIRKCPSLHEVYAVIGRYGDGRFELYCLNDNTHYECEPDFLKNRTKVVKQGIPDLLDIIKKRYTDEIINVVYNLRYVTKL